MPDLSLYQNIPQELKDLKQWVTWKLELLTNGKWTKRPYNPRNGMLASVTNPNDWSDYDTVILHAGHYSGIGFVFCDSDPYCGIDLDHTDDQELLAAQQKIYAVLNSYSERSPSGNGCHILVRASVLKGTRQGPIEVYSSGRFFTMTGDVVANVAIADRQAEINELFIKLGGNENGYETYDTESRNEFESDDVILDRCRGAANGAHFIQLFEGEWLRYFDGEGSGATDRSQSAADQALINKLALHTQNHDQLKRLFMASNLAATLSRKPKPDYYLNLTIRKALDRMLPAGVTDRVTECALACLARYEAEQAAIVVEKHATEVAAASIVSSTAYEFDAEEKIPPRAWLYNGHYIRKFLTTTISKGGLGKSSLSMVEAVAMATGEPLLGVTPHRALNVWIWNGEDPMDELKRRAAGIMRHYNLTAKNVGGRLRMDSGRTMPICVASQTREGIKFHDLVIEAIREDIKRNKIDVMIIDPFIACHDVSENDNGAIEAVASIWKAIAEDANCCIELVHHTNKSGGGAKGPSTVEDSRGASSLHGAVRSSRVLNAMTDKEAEALGIAPGERFDYVRVGTEKANMARLGGSVWRQKIDHALDNGDEEYHYGDNVAVIANWVPSSPDDNLLDNHLHFAQQMVAGGGEFAENVRSKSWLGHTLAPKLGFNLEDKNQKARLIKLIQRWVLDGYFIVQKKWDDRQQRERPIIIVGKPYQNIGAAPASGLV